MVMKKLQRSWSMYGYVLIFVLGFGTSGWAQEVYFAENPPMELDANTTVFTGYTVEYSAKNYGSISLELWNGSTLVGRGTYLVRKRGSNTANLQIKRNDIHKALVPGSNYHYKLSIKEQQARATNTYNKRINRQTLTTSFSQSSTTKNITKTTIVNGVSVVQK